MLSRLVHAMTPATTWCKAGRSQAAHAQRPGGQGILGVYSAKAVHETQVLTSSNSALIDSWCPSNRFLHQDSRHVRLSVHKEVS